jgi:hypothetical protein
VLDQKQAFQHMVAWAIHNLYNCYVEANDIKLDEKLTDAEKTLKIKAVNGPDHRMLNYMLLLKPALEQAELEFPNHKDNFFAWFKDRWALVKELNLVEGQCSCKGCKQEETVVS